MLNYADLQAQCAPFHRHKRTLWLPELSRDVVCFVTKEKHERHDQNESWIGRVRQYRG